MGACVLRKMLNFQHEGCCLTSNYAVWLSESFRQASYACWLVSGVSLRCFCMPVVVAFVLIPFGPICDLETYLCDRGTRNRYPVNRTKVTG